MSKKKYEQGPEQRCEHTSLKRQSTNMSLPRHNYIQTSIKYQDSEFKNQCDHDSLKCFKCDHDKLTKSCNMFPKCHNYDHVTSKCHNYDHGSFQGKKCDLMNNGQRRCKNFRTYDNNFSRQ